MNGSKFEWFIGRVVNNNDPKRLGRIQVRSLGSQTSSIGGGLSDEDCLWAFPISSPQSASLSGAKTAELSEKSIPSWIDGIGMSPTGIEVGSYVIGFYADSVNKNNAFIMGTYHKMSMVPEPPSEAGTKFTQSAPTDGVLLSDVAGVATGTNTLANEKASKKTIGKQGKVTEPDSAYGAEYPNNKTITTKSGHVIELDDTEGKERIHIYHKSGTYVEINETGKIVFKSVDDRYDIVDANAKILVTGNVTMEVDGNVDETIMGNRTTTILGSDTTIVTGKIYRKSSASIKDEAPRIDHN